MSIMTVFLLKTAVVTLQNQISKILTKRKSRTRMGTLLDVPIRCRGDFIVIAMLKWLTMTKQTTEDKSFLNAIVLIKGKK